MTTNPLTCSALGNLLKGDYRIRVATSGEKALAIAQDPEEKPPDLILLDIQLSGMDGYEVCRHLKGNESTNAIAVIFVTALDATSDEELGLKLGAVDYITKPFSPAIVRARVNTHLQLKRKTDLLEQYARLDGLTGIPNRRHFDEQLDSEIKYSLREGHPLSVIMIDIDHFKPFNDNFGHGAGDQCLQQVSATLSAAAKRPTDRVCRYGGEEFVALLPNTDGAGARQLAEIMRSSIEDLGIKHPHSSVSPVLTISLGTTTFSPQEGADKTSLLKRADQALYDAKHAGRNRIATSSLPDQRAD